MDCITCGREAGYNRAVVDVFNGIELGGFCMNCEKTEFGNSLARGYWDRGADCALCGRDGYYALPLWQPVTREEGDRLVNGVEYEVTDDTLLLCDEHLHAIRDRPAPAGASAATGSRPNASD